MNFFVATHGVDTIIHTLETMRSLDLPLFSSLKACFFLSKTLPLVYSTLLYLYLGGTELSTDNACNTGGTKRVVKDHQPGTVLAKLNVNIFWGCARGVRHGLILCT